MQREREREKLLYAQYNQSILRSFSLCFSAEMSAFYALVCFGLGGIVYAAGRSKRLAISMAYFGLMELLQTVQYMFVATPQDDYAMCQSPTNQFLTVLGLVHICFQPYFCNMAFGAPLRPNNLHFRYMNDMVLRLCLLYAGWMFGRYWWAMYWPDNPNLAARPSEACPNYEWIRDGYDSGIGWTTPNLPGHSCTFLANTETRHIAWAFPLYQATYFVPGVSVHAFLLCLHRPWRLSNTFPWPLCYSSRGLFWPLGLRHP